MIEFPVNDNVPWLHIAFMFVAMAIIIAYGRKQVKEKT